MTHCAHCHRPMKHPTESGLGPVCAKKNPPPPVVERDLFGYDTAAAAHAARERVGLHVDALAAEAHAAVRAGFRRVRAEMAA